MALELLLSSTQSDCFHSQVAAGEKLYSEHLSSPVQLAGAASSDRHLLLIKQRITPPPPLLLLLLLPTSTIFPTHDHHHPPFVPHTYIYPILVLNRTVGCSCSSTSHANVPWVCTSFTALLWSSVLALLSSLICLFDNTVG